MFKDDKTIKRRTEFVQSTLKNPEEGARRLRDLALSLENTNTSSDVIYALSQILYVSERTIERDLIRDL